MATLSDKSAKALVDCIGGFEEHKAAAVQLSSEILPRSVWYADRAAKIAQCGTFLRLQEAEEGGGLQLVASNLCRLRLCPMCEWRRSLRRYLALAAAVDYLGSSCAWLHVVLTVPNAPGAELSAAITALYSRFTAFWRKQAPGVWLGYYRGLEVTYSPNRDDFHPHLHLLVPVKPGYFSGRDYLKQAELQQRWGYICHISRVKDLGQGIAEVVKYACKPLHLGEGLDAERAAAVYDVLAQALHGRRMVQTGGAVKEALRVVGQLEKLDADEPTTDQTDTARPFYEFYWHFGAGKYVQNSGQ